MWRGGFRRKSADVLCAAVTAPLLAPSQDSVPLLDPVDRGDAGMVERGEDLSLAAEPGQPLRQIGHLGREHLEGDVAAELVVASPEHLAHPARTDRLEDLAVPHAGSGGEVLHAANLTGPRRGPLVAPRRRLALRDVLVVA